MLKSMDLKNAREELWNLSVLISNWELQFGSWQLDLNKAKIKCIDTVLWQLLKLECQAVVIQPPTNIYVCCVDTVVFEAHLRNETIPWQYLCLPKVVMISICYYSSYFSMIKEKSVTALQLFLPKQMLD